MRYFLFLLTALTVFSCSSQANQAAGASTGPAESPDIQIQITGQAPGQASLIALLTDQQYRLDSAVVDAGGHVRFQREEPYPAGMLYVLLPGNSSFPLLVDQDQTMTLKSQAGTLIPNMQVEGNLDTELLYQTTAYEDEYQARLSPISQQMRGLAENDPRYAQLKAQQDALMEERKVYLQEIFDKYPNTLFTKFKMAGQNPDVRDARLPDGSRDVASQAYHYRMEFWDNVDLTDERLLRTPVIINKLKRYITQLTPQHQDSIIKATDFLVQKVIAQPNSEYYKFFTNWVALNYEPGKSTLMDAEAVLVHIVQNYFTKEKAFWAGEAEVFAMQQRAYEMAASRIGQKGPDVVSKDPSGQTRSLYELTAPYVIVFMYNPTCEHCIEETPQLMRYYRQWKSQGLGVQVFAIAIDTENAEWKSFINKNGLQEWVNVFDPTNESIYAKYYVDNTPEIYVLNKDRTIIAKNLNPDQVGAVIQRDMEKQG
jgi:peroxiredoxin